MIELRFVIAACLMLGSPPAWADTVAGDAAFAAQDYAAAREEWLQSAAEGDASAMSALGTLYDIGYGVPQDFAAALDWYRRAGTAGDVRAMFNTGVMYDAGRGVAPDRPEALRWYDMAAARGNGRAAFAAGLMLRDGDGVRRNRPRAIHYFRIAAQAGIRAAQDNLRVLGARSSARPAPSPRTRAAAPDLVQEYVTYLRAAVSADPVAKAAALRGAAEVSRIMTEEQRAVAREELLHPR